MLIDDQVTHELAFDIGCAKLTDEITRAGLDAFIRALGFPRVTPALLTRVRDLVTAAVAHRASMVDPDRADGRRCGREGCQGEG